MVWSLKVDPDRRVARLGEKWTGFVTWPITEKHNKNNTSSLHPFQQLNPFALSMKYCLQYEVNMHTHRHTHTQKAKIFSIFCLSVSGPGRQICCQFVLLISMFSAVLTDGETLGWLPWKAVINTTWEAAASALTPCRGCLLGPRSRGQCLPFTPRYPCPLPWPYPAGKICTPWDGKPISAPRPSSPTHHNPSLLPHSLFPFASFPFSSAQIHCRCNCLDSFTEWYRWCRPPSLSSILSVSAVYIQVIFALNHSSGNWCDLEENVCVF